MENNNLINIPEAKENKVNNKTHNKVLNYYIKLVIIFAVLSLTFWIGFEKGQKNTDSSRSVPPFVTALDGENNKDVDFSLFWRVWDLLQEKYVDSEKITSKELLYNSIKGMLWATEDPYTIFLDPEENKEFNEDIEGKFEGIGAEMGIKQGILTIIAPLRNSPAEKSGLRAGDKVLKINGESTGEMSVDEAVSKIRGAKDTEVKLTIFRNGGEEKTTEISVIRDVIEVKSVQFEIKNGKIPYFNIVRFGDETARDFKSFIKDVPADSPGIIIDLRNDPGGYLNAAIDIAGTMLPRGKVVVIEEDKEGKQQNTYSRGTDKLSNFKTIVLINEGNASASEILAGALRDNRDNVTIVGKQSFGKGSVQELINLEDGAAVKITIAKWLTPNGEQINEKGITPDIEIDLTTEDYENDRDPQLDKAIEELTE